jgi:hypothetical protein
MAPGITEYLRISGRRKVAQQIAPDESRSATAPLYDRWDHEAAVVEVQRILI